MKRLFTTLLLTTLPCAAVADTQLERLEVISEQMNDVMFEMMIREAVKEGANPEPLRAAVPDGSWDAPMRDAGRCLLDRYVEASSASAVNTMLDEMELAIPQMADMDMDAMGEDFDFLPEGISEDQSIQINSDCGVAELMMERMDGSGFMQAMMEAMAGN